MKEFKKRCRYFNTCNAPFCPIDKNLNDSIWYPDESICILPEFSKLTWIKKQKTIKKLSTSTNTYFTVQMLNRNFRVTKAIKGLSPDKDIDYEATALNKWLKKHPELKKRQLNQRSLDALKKVNCNRPTNSNRSV